MDSIKGIKTMKRFRQLAGALLVGAGILSAPGVQAEGSRTLYPNGISGNRASLDLTPTEPNAIRDYLGKIKNQGFFYVYAKAGEQILVGSSNRTGAGVGVIKVFTPQSFGSKGSETVPSSASFTCTAGTDGYIQTRAQELAGPQSADFNGNTGGYRPCVVSAGATGIYGVQFTTASGGASTPNGSLANVQAGSSSVWAWDITVRSDTASTTDINGRVFTYAWSADAGGNNRALNPTLYYVSSDGYRYSQTLRNLDPYAFVMFSNAQGFLDNGQPLYKDLRSNIPNGGNGANNISLAAPSFYGAVDPTNSTGTIETQAPQYPIFFSDIGPANTNVNDTLTALGIPTVPKPPQVNSFRFSYPPVNTSTSYVGQGGVFEFNVTDTISFQIVISKDGSDFDPANPDNRVLTGLSGTGAYSMVWDGKDNAGNNMPASDTPYKFRISGRNGEVHFPFVDVESNTTGGPTIAKLNGNIKDSLVYYDDRGYKTSGGVDVGTLNDSLCGNPAANEPTPNQGLNGIDSADANYNGPGKYYRSWTAGTSAINNTDCGNNQGFGNMKALDLWTYQVTLPQSNELTILDYADVKAVVSAPVSALPGGAVTVSVGYGNVGSQVADGATYTLKLASGLADVSCNGANCSYDPATGIVTVGGLPASLSPGQWANLTVSYTAPAAGNNVPVLATVGTTSPEDSAGGQGLAPNQASAITVVGATNVVDVMTTVTAPASSVPDGTVAVDVVYANAGGITATGVTYGLQLTPGLDAATVTCSVTCTYDATTGVAMFTGVLPTDLTPGQSVPVKVTYVAVANDPVTVTSNVGASGDSNTANNTASGTTTPTITPNPLDPMADVTTTVNPPATAAPGAMVDVPVRFGNLGDNAATITSYTLTLPTGMDSAAVSCASPVVCIYNAGTVTVNGLPPTLAPGAWTDLTLRYPAPVSGVVEVTSTVSTSTPEGGRIANNTAKGATTVVTATTGADVAVTVQPPAKVAVNTPVNVPVTLTNVGPDTANGVTTTIKLPPGLTGVSCNGNGITCTYTPADGKVTLTGTPTTLTPGQSVPFTLIYTSPPAPGSVPVEATIGTTSNDPNTGNNKSTGTTAVTDDTILSDMTTTVTVPSKAALGSTVEATVTYKNEGGLQATGVGYKIEGVPTGGAVTYGGATCTYDSGTGMVTGCGLPPTRNPGESVELKVSYPAPAGPVTLKSTVSSTDPDANTANNTAQGTSTTGHPVTATVDPTSPVGSGTVSCSPAAVSGVALDDQSTCTAAPATGYRVKQWTGDCAAATGNACALTGITGPKSSTVVFEAIPWNVTAVVSTPGAGTIGACATAVVVANGTGTSCVVTPNPGFTFTGWTITTGTAGICAPANGNTCAITNVTSDVVLTANFTPITYPVDATVTGGNGTVSCAPNPAAHGATATCTAVPDAGYRVKTWTGDCAGAAGNACSLPNVTGAKTSTVEFELAPASAPASIPTLSQWGLIILSGLMALLGLSRRRRNV